MRIILAGPFPEPITGVSYANSVLFSHLREHGHIVEIINTATPIISGKQGDRFSLRKALAFLHAYLGIPLIFRSDVLYTTPGQTFFGLLKYAPFIVLARLLKKPYVIHLHGNHLGHHYAHLNGIQRRVFRWLVSGASAGIVLSSSLRSNFRELLSDDKVFVVENFAGDKFFSKQNIDKPTDILRIIYLSNLMRDKGIFVLLDALEQLKTRGITYHARLAGHVEPDVSSELRDRLARLGDSVEFNGVVSGTVKHEALERANVFVLPTHYPMEGQPISILEGMATGNIIVSTRHAGIPDIVGDDNGVLIPIKDAAALADTLESISANLGERMAHHSNFNRQYAKSRFTEKAFSDRISVILKQSVESLSHVKIGE